MERTLKAAIIGAGNVATHLAKKLSESTTITQIYSRNIDNARTLASATGTEAIDDINLLSKDADIYIISVKDDAIPEIVAQAGKSNALWVHTSGSVAMETLAPISRHYGVLYPMQTFSKEIAVDMEKVPIFIEGCDKESLDKIRLFAERISPNVSEADSDARKKLHIAAVFACNFTNYLWGFSVDILKSIGQDLSVMEPLVKATFEKALNVSPHEGQTGPARRNDLKTIQKHLDELQGDAKDIYSLLSLNIIKKYHNEQS
ncbi:MAG: F420-dependent NADP oxidoreductase [Bacteroides sp.]|nr:F420-dependent NADP oxidoreductase [Bacteroides sp.]MCM1389869.1 F420-dependent NADP oxidoreductase [Bacteroides sp.]